MKVEKITNPLIGFHICQFSLRWFSNEIKSKPIYLGPKEDEEKQAKQDADKAREEAKRKAEEENMDEDAVKRAADEVANKVLLEGQSDPVSEGEKKFAFVTLLDSFTRLSRRAPLCNCF